MQDEGRGDAAGERVEQKLDRVGSLVVAEQDGGLAIDELEGFAARLVLTARAVEVSNCKRFSPPLIQTFLARNWNLARVLSVFMAAMVSPAAWTSRPLI